VSTLKESGFSESQAAAVMNALVLAMSESQKVNQQTQATKVEFTALQSEMNEKVFNLTLKFDMQSKHIREMSAKDFNALKNDVVLLQKTSQTDLSALKTELTLAEKVPTELWKCLPQHLIYVTLYTPLVLSPTLHY
jgi:hypothetical protein